MPLEIRRVYGSFNEEFSQDFGYGWNLAPAGCSRTRDRLRTM